MDHLKKELQALVEDLNGVTRKAAALLASVAPPASPAERRNAREEKPVCRSRAGRPAKTASVRVGKRKGKKTSSAELPAETERRKVMKMISDMREDGASFDQIARKLESKSIPTFSGRGRWRKQTVHKLYQRNAH
ncbi:hypothetical protein DENIS_1271 [Desulfonema ishimotonii]|uniref:Recombinase domain-containing protein n=1 Tax=Desulfonema ishimotonii TaxID=45657 RepID=A0A401FTN5_9BACT|nr:recombinase family protein [Desulfonema ishimotonii]GBC60320.1 hypothetical protein DENIS_1271 [Desulfonema ishimotonii]